MKIIAALAIAISLQTSQAPQFRTRCYNGRYWQYCDEYRAEVLESHIPPPQLTWTSKVCYNETCVEDLLNTLNSEETKNVKIVYSPPSYRIFYQVYR